MKNILGFLTLAILFSANALAFAPQHITTCYASDGFNHKYMKVDIVEMSNCPRCAPREFLVPVYAKVSIFAGVGRGAVEQLYRFESVQNFRLTQTTYAKSQSGSESGDGSWEAEFPEKIVVWSGTNGPLSIAYKGQSYDLQCGSKN